MCGKFQIRIMFFIKVNTNFSSSQVKKTELFIIVVTFPSVPTVHIATLELAFPVILLPPHTQPINTQVAVIFVSF